MNWIISYKEYSLAKEITVRYENHITVNALKGFYFRFKREVLTPREPEELSWSEGTPSVNIDHTNRVAIITFISRVVPTEEIKDEIEKIAEDFLRLKTSEELAAAKEEAYKKTEGYHIRQQMLGFEQKKEKKEEVPVSDNRGGKREGSGRKSKNTALLSTETTSIRVPNMCCGTQTKGEI